MSMKNLNLNTTFCIGSMQGYNRMDANVYAFKYNILYRFNYASHLLAGGQTIFKYNILYRFNKEFGFNDPIAIEFKYNILYRFNSLEELLTRKPI